MLEYARIEACNHEIPSYIITLIQVVFTLLHIISHWAFVHLKHGRGKTCNSVSLTLIATHYFLFHAECEVLNTAGLFWGSATVKKLLQILQL